MRLQTLSLVHFLTAFLVGSSRADGNASTPSAVFYPKSVPRVRLSLALLDPDIVFRAARVAAVRGVTGEIRGAASAVRQRAGPIRSETRFARPVLVDGTVGLIAQHIAWMRGTEKRKPRNRATHSQALRTPVRIELKALFFRHP